MSSLAMDECPISKIIHCVIVSDEYHACKYSFACRYVGVLYYFVETEQQEGKWLILVHW